MSALNSRVVVVGGGIIGLTSALALLEEGFKNVHIIAASFDETTSHVAGAIWMPFALPANVNPYKPKQWCEIGIAWLEKIRKQHGQEATGIHWVEGLDVSGEGPPPVVHPYWAHCVRNFRLLTKDEAEGVSPDMAHGFAFETIIYSPPILMKWLYQEINRLGGTFETRKLTDLHDIDADIIVNCTGLAAKEVAGDETVYPIRGQTIRVYNPNITKFLMAVHPDSSHTYILPRPNGDIVLGGTVQPHNWNTESDEAEVQALWERCCRLYPEVKNSTIRGNYAGLRPQRVNAVRLEVDVAPTRKGAMVIHNYGHAGSGHTLQWGCAQDVVQLAKKCTPIRKHTASRL